MPSRVKQRRAVDVFGLVIAVVVLAASAHETPPGPLPQPRAPVR
ncbi:hypothetical protein [Nonomuraea mesophila]|nr:hypothetical protein [Nonomuraea mesophila]